MTYNEQGKRIRSENLAGQVTTTAWDGWSVTYNDENRPVLWENVSTNSSTHNSSNPPLISMSYDRMGRRVTKNAQRFVYNGYLQIANFGHQTSNIKLQTFIWDPTEKVATRPLVWFGGTFTAFYTYDGNKNVSEVIASNGDGVAHYEHAPFGTLMAKERIGVIRNPWRFSSEYAETDSGIVYYNFRHYDHLCGRWISRDPFPDDIQHPYLFCANAAVGNMDWIGLKCKKCKPGMEGSCIIY